MRRKYNHVWICFLSIILVISCTSNTQDTLVTKANTPQRIVSLAPSLTYSIYLLQCQDKLVGCTDYCILPEKDTNSIKRIASAIDVNVEEVIKLNPDLIVTSSLTDSKTIAAFTKLGVKVEIYPYAKSYNDICNQLISLSQSIGKEELAQQIVAASRMEIQRIWDSIKDKDPVKVFMQIGTKPIFTVIDSSFVNDFIVMAGGVNIASGLKNGMYSREQVISQNPDVIIITDMGSIGIEEKKVWETYTSMKAAQTNRIYVIGSDEVCSPTPVSFITTLKKFVAMIQTDSLSNNDQ